MTELVRDRRTVEIIKSATRRASPSIYLNAQRFPRVQEKASTADLSNDDPMGAAAGGIRTLVAGIHATEYVVGDTPETDIHFTQDVLVGSRILFLGLYTHAKRFVVPLLRPKTR